MRPTPTLCLLLLAAVTNVALGQDSAPQKPQPDPDWRKNFTRPPLDQKRSTGPVSMSPKMSLPTKKLFPSGLFRKIYPNGFARIPIPEMHRPSQVQVPTPKPGERSGWSGPLATQAGHPIGGIVKDWIAKASPDVNLINKGARMRDASPDTSSSGVIRSPQGTDPRAALIDHQPGTLTDAQRRGIVKDKRHSSTVVRSSRKDRAGVPMVTTRPTSETDVQGAGTEMTEQERPALDDFKLVGQKPSAAAEQLRVYLKDRPDDFKALRMLAITQLLAKNHADAASIMLRAYTSDPLLADEPIKASEFGLEGGKLTGMVSAALTGAKGTNTPQSWLLVVVLQQGQGQKAAAQASLEKARGAKLDADLADGLQAALGEMKGK